MSVDPRAIESLLAFWSETGVDTLYGEGPLDRTTTAPARDQPTASRARIAATPSGRDRQIVATPTPQKPPAPSPTPPDVVAIARDAANAAADLAALKAAIIAFDGCPLKAGARQAVFARGRPEAPIMVIGEAPGADEDAQGLPFVGRAGQLLDRMLGAAGLADQVFITNTVFWRPPGNRTPHSEEQAVCAPFLERAIELVRPRLLLLVGGAAAKAMLRKSEGILSLRGRWEVWRPTAGGVEIPALPTLHPAFLLRQPAAKRKSWEDMLRLAEGLESPPSAG
jgi:DNA polymerase